MLNLHGEDSQKHGAVTALRLGGDRAWRDRVAFVGNCVNDAGALARADVGTAGSEVALQAADVMLLSDFLGRLSHAHRPAFLIARAIKQNLRFALGATAVMVGCSSTCRCRWSCSAMRAARYWRCLTGCGL